MGCAGKSVAREGLAGGTPEKGWHLIFSLCFKDLFIFHLLKQKNKEVKKAKRSLLTSYIYFVL